MPTVEERLATLEQHRHMRDLEWEKLLASNERQEQMLVKLSRQWELATFPLAMVKYFAGVASGVGIIIGWIKYGPK